MKKITIYVYVQAIPNVVSGHVKKFADLQSSSNSFRLSHSSKVALAKVTRRENFRVVAIGHSSVLREAIVRGANDAIPLPLCDDPLAQAENVFRSLPGPLAEGEVSIVVGENLDGPFSGAALCGALSVVCGQSYAIEPKDGNLEQRGIILVKDEGRLAPNVDIRRIAGAFASEIPETNVEGDSGIDAIEAKKSDIVIGLPVEELATSIARRLRRWSG